MQESDDLAGLGLLLRSDSVLSLLIKNSDTRGAEDLRRKIEEQFFEFPAQYFQVPTKSEKR